MAILNIFACVPAGEIQFCFWFGAERRVQILVLIHTEVWGTRIWSDEPLLHGWDLKKKKKKTFEKSNQTLQEPYLLSKTSSALDICHHDLTLYTFPSRYENQDWL